MTAKNLSTVATDVIESYGITAINVVNAYRFGGERMIKFVDSRFETAVNNGGSMLNKNVRSNMIERQQRFSGYYVKGLQYGAERIESVVGAAVDLASKGVGLVSSNAERIEGESNVKALEAVNRIALPVANVYEKLVDRIEKGSSILVERVAGNHMPVKAVATRKLNSVKSEAAATRKRVVKTAKKRVGKAVAQTATETSNVARRVARKAKASVAAA